MKAKFYNQKGQEAGEVELPERVFAAKWRADLVHQVVLGMRSNQRAGTAHAKARGEVRGGGRKPWKQKGTGRARHGSTRSPIWVGGGVTHGPLREKNYKKKISKKMRSEALFSVLSQKFKEGEILFIDSLVMPKIKTKEAEAMLKNLEKAAGWKLLSKSQKPKAQVALFSRNEQAEKSLRNIPSLELSLVKNLNPLQVLSRKYLLIENPEASVKFLADRGIKKHGN